MCDVETNQVQLWVDLLLHFEFHGQEVLIDGRRVALEGNLEYFFKADDTAGDSSLDATDNSLGDEQFLYLVALEVVDYAKNDLLSDPDLADHYFC